MTNWYKKNYKEIEIPTSEERKSYAKHLSDKETLNKHLNKFARNEDGTLKYDTIENAENYMKVDHQNSDYFVDNENDEIKKEKEPPKLTEKDLELIEIAKKNLKDPNLMNLIKEELDKKHLGDNNLKMTAFLIAISAHLPDDKQRCSMALTGDSSAGKDNLIKTIFFHMPDSLFLTGATQPAMEDQAVFTKILGISEMNLFKEHGANKNLLEVVKQRTEGGTSSMKKDVSTRFKTTKIEKTEQGTVFYGTTDSERDKEMETRFIFGDVLTDNNKIIKVNQNTAEIYANPTKKLESLEKNSWIKKAIEILENDPKRCQSLIPFAPLLTGKINDKTIINDSNPRSMRDFKRILCITSAKTWLFKHQRKRYQKKGINFVISSIEDFLEVMEYSQDLFNSTFAGIDGRLKEMLDLVDNYDGEWIPRDYLQKQLNKTRNTVKTYCNALSDNGLIEGCKGSELNLLGNGGYHSSKIYYKRCQKGIKKGLITCQLSELKTYLESKKEEINIIINNIIKENDEIENKEIDNTYISNEIDTFKLIPFKNNVNPLNENNKEDIYAKVDIPEFLNEEGKTLGPFTSGTKVIINNPKIQNILFNDNKLDRRLEIK